MHFVINPYSYHTVDPDVLLQLPFNTAEMLDISSYAVVPDSVGVWDAGRCRSDGVGATVYPRDSWWNKTTKSYTLEWFYESGAPAGFASNTFLSLHNFFRFYRAD